MKRLGLSMCAALAMTAGTASATPLRLDYCVTALGPNSFRYTFTLTLDNHDNSWVAGQGWRWLIYGDIANNTPSPLTNWVGDPSSLPIGPWTFYTTSGGGHNGPTLGDVLTYWVPPAVGASLTWQGTSDSLVQEPNVLFSTLAGTLGGGIAADFEVAHMLPSCAGQVTGACCTTNGACIVTTSGNCTAISGVYRGDNAACATANCPAGGACCLTDGNCTTLTSAACAAQGGIYRGDGSPCATANCPLPQGVWVEQGEAGDFMETANVTRGQGSLIQIRGNLGSGDADMYAFRICDPASFSASTVNGASIDTQLFLFTASGLGVASDDDDPYGSGTLQSHLTNLFTSSAPAGVYFIAVSQYDKDPVDSSAQAIWSDTPFNVERAPDGPGAANPIASWDAGGGGGGAYTIFMTGSCFAVDQGSTCYANCDHSTTVPCLNVLDFTCFLNAFAASSTYANCDASTQPPVLNVLDFTCFLNRFAAGCSSC